MQVHNGQSIARPGPASAIPRRFKRGEGQMNWEQIRGQLQQVSAGVKQKWAKLSDDDLKLLEGKKDAFVGRLMQKYGLMKEDAERQLDDVLNRVGRAPHSSPPSR
jgi:uncharacterized protein YjbJ (UPF0337 family)